MASTADAPDDRFTEPVDPCKTRLLTDAECNRALRLAVPEGVLYAVMVGCASFRSWPRSTKLSRMSCWMFK